MADGTARGEAADKAPVPRLKGEAAWKAQRDAMDQQNAAARKRAHDRKSGAADLLVAREQRLGRQEAAQLRALNTKLGVRAPERS